MNYKKDNDQEDTEKELTDIVFDKNTKTAKMFTCPNCGELTQDDVIFLCNTCNQAEMIEKDGMYICPECLIPGENFECFHCGSKEVKLSTKKAKEIIQNQS